MEQCILQNKRIIEKKAEVKSQLLQKYGARFYWFAWFQEKIAISNPVYY